MLCKKIGIAYKFRINSTGRVEKQLQTGTFAAKQYRGIMATALAPFLEILQTAAASQGLIKLTLGNRKNKESELKNVFIKPVILKSGNKLSFVYRYPTKDITKNFDGDEAAVLIEKMLAEDFYNADLFTASHDYHLLQDKNGAVKIVTKGASLSVQDSSQQHDKIKNRIVKPGNNIYLHRLGITTAEGAVKKERQDKYKQINRYIEIIEGIVKDLYRLGGNGQAGISVVDMGSGKGYLTFALYDYLSNVLHLDADIAGIEIRPGLVDACNDIAAAAKFTGLHFEKGTIADTALTATDMLIALHACDTATDDAIYKGIQANARVIICAPCCHKQIRKQMKPGNALSSITRHGILLERQAEMVTDAIRALLLESAGYTTKVFEFIETAHTPKNVMIVGIKNETGNTKKEEVLEKVKALKSLFNIKEHYLEGLLRQ